MSSLLARNVQSAVPFYQEVFGWHVQPFDAGGADAVLLRLPGYVGGLPEQPVPRDVVAVAMQDSRIEADRWLVDFWIDDVEKAVERVVDGGGSVIEPPSDAGMFRRAVLADFAGAIFTISQLIKHRNAAGNGAS